MFFKIWNHASKLIRRCCAVWIWCAFRRCFAFVDDLLVITFWLLNFWFKSLFVLFSSFFLFLTKTINGLSNRMFFDLEHFDGSYVQFIIKIPSEFIAILQLVPDVVLLFPKTAYKKIILVIWTIESMIIHCN